MGEAERRVTHVAGPGVDRGALIACLHGLLVEGFGAEV